MSDRRGTLSAGQGNVGPVETTSACRFGAAVLTAVALLSCAAAQDLPFGPAYAERPTPRALVYAAQAGAGYGCLLAAALPFAVFIGTAPDLERYLLRYIVAAPFALGAPAAFGYGAFWAGDRLDPGGTPAGAIAGAYAGAVASVALFYVAAQVPPRGSKWYTIPIFCAGAAALPVGAIAGYGISKRNRGWTPDSFGGRLDLPALSLQPVLDGQGNAQAGLVVRLLTVKF